MTAAMPPRLLVLLALAIAVQAATPAKPALARRASEAPLVLSQRRPLAPPAKPSLIAGLPLGGLDVPLLLYFAFWYLGERVGRCHGLGANARTAPDARPPPRRAARPTAIASSLERRPKSQT